MGKNKINMNYEIIKDKGELLRFIEWLPNLTDGEKYYVSLFSRKKYDSSGLLKSDKNQLKRFVSNKEMLYDKIKQLEVSLGSYRFEDKGIPNETLALYITPNPRSTHKAGLETLIELVRKIKNDDTIYNPHSIALNSLQTCASRKIYFDIDVDFKKNYANHFTYKEMYNFFIDKINKEAISCIIKTRGGYHVLLELDKISEEYSKKWYKNINSSGNEIFDITMNSDNLIPVPGCLQGAVLCKHYSYFYL